MQSMHPLDFFKIAVLVILLIILFRATRAKDEAATSSNRYQYVDSKGRKLSWWQVNHMYPDYIRRTAPIPPPQGYPPQNYPPQPTSAPAPYYPKDSRP